MRNLLGKIIEGAAILCRIGTVAAFAVLIIVVTLQVLGRIPGISAPIWTEEVSRFALLYLVAFSCGLAALDGELVNVDLVTSMLPAKVQVAIDKLVDVATIVFSLMIIPGAYAYVMNSFGERARSFDAPMVIVYITILIIPVSLAFFYLGRLLGFGKRMQHQETL
ncbi:MULTISPECIES: TRAP transporter small permease [Phyllobacteriaceae]|uniref:TRAP transporter small permease protein n=1 Tax=Phyllobacterium phragmitis TaxID=2670329 RepID=A0ABQ0H463_9HYPH|nr:TRAP transporter small permease subunit [Mesorhizobium sp. RMAD-H1]MBB2971779.1 TRAP-type C4-dicarboxylate transport system permease small subunit [Mesorhizobium sp. RMAD-H1]